MVAILKIIAVSMAFLDVEVQITTLDGVTTQGVLQQLDADNMAVASANDAPTTVAVDSVLKMEFTGAAVAGKVATASEAIFWDQSRVPLQKTTASAETLTAESDLLGQLQIPRTLLRAVRLNPLKVEWQLQWNSFLDRDNKQDLLVVEKRDGTGLDFLAGVVSSISTEDISFLLDGDEIPVPRSRVFGVVFANDQNASKQQTASVSLRLLSGGTLQASDVVLENNRFEFQSAWGQMLSLANDQLTELDYSSGRLHYLSDLEPLTERYFGLDPPGKEWGELFSKDADTRTGLSSQWRMSRDRFPNNGRPPLMLHNRVYKKGVCLFPSAAIEYALDGKYSQFTAMVGVDDDVASNQQQGRAPTAVELRVEADGKQIFQKIVSAPDEPFLLDLDLSGVNTLTVIVDFGDGESTCDYLDLADAKLIVNTQQK